MSQYQQPVLFHLQECEEAVEDLTELGTTKLLVLFILGSRVDDKLDGRDGVLDRNIDQTLCRLAVEAEEVENELHDRLVVTFLRDRLPECLKRFFELDDRADLDIVWVRVALIIRCHHARDLPLLRIVDLVDAITMDEHVML